MMRYVRVLSIIAMLFCVLSSCGKGAESMKDKICAQDRNIVEIVSKRYSESQLITITQTEKSLEELNIQYPIECLRQDGNTYRASYLGENSVAVISFDGDGNKILGKVYDLYLTKDDYSELVPGISLERVQNVDPHGEYLFLYTGRNDTPKVSSHYTKDGYLIIFEYDKDNVIINKTVDLI